MHAENTEVHTERLLLRPLWESDRAAVVALHVDPATNRFNHDPPDETTMHARFDRWLDVWAESGIGYWAVVEPSSGELLGLGGVQPLDEAGERVLNLAYRFTPGAWGRGYARETARAALEWARRVSPDTPVQAVVRDTNLPSMRVAQRCGLTEFRRRTKEGIHEVLFRLPAGR